MPQSPHSSNARRRVGVFPGQFDPITNGHLDVISRASETMADCARVLLPSAVPAPLAAE